MYTFTLAQQKKALFWLAFFHILVIAASNYLVQFPFELFGLHTTWGAFTFPFIFLTTDLTVRIFGSTLARRMLAHPQPIIVACPGHAVAKGAFVLLSADYRIGVEGPFNIGLNEVKIGMTMHHVGIALARDRLTTPAFQRSVINAEMFSPQGALAAGFLDQVVAPEQLLSAAVEVAQQMKKLNVNGL